ncbi:glycosyl transferase family 90 [Saccharospirillum sp.]|uniref:glycosyl transferase family 90 n=1 Tax=Saccharospirillum sp. TaxID=2033801 RepID=UPI0034A06DD2
MDAILHLGTEKTGTSTIQRFLKHNRESLMAQGFYFMKSTGPADDRKLSVYCLMDGQFDDYHKNNLIDSEEKKAEFEKSLEKDVETELSQLPASVHTVIFSSEHLHSRVRELLQRDKLKSFLERFFGKIKLVSYLRPQVEMAVSHYSTYLKTQGVGELGEYLKQCHQDNYYYDYFKFLSGWQESFPLSPLIVRIFGRDELVDGDVVADFCNVVGLNFTKLEVISIANESVTPTGQELLKLINKYFPVSVEGIGQNTARVAFVQIISSMYSGPGSKPGKELAEQMQGQFDDINEKVRKKWFFDRDSLFQMDFDKFSISGNVDWAVVEFFDKFISEYRKKNPVQLAGLTPRLVDNLRDFALRAEADGDISKALSIMEIARVLRPDGPKINKKVKEYNQLIKSPVFENQGDRRRFYLSNNERVAIYFDKGISSSGGDDSLKEGFIAGKPFLFNLDSVTKGSVPPTPLIQNYVDDFIVFLEVVGSSVIPVQLGDLELDSGCPSGLVFKKARSIDGKGIILKLNKKRHWDFYENFDRFGWKEKNNGVIWRGAPTGIKNVSGYSWDHNNRYVFVNKYFVDYDIGFSKVGKQGDESITPLVRGVIPRGMQLKSKYLISLEGNDVATNLKWILASNSVPIMAAPTKESWLLESQLIPFVHYVPLNDELDNLDEVYEWCLNNDEHCRQIAENGKRYMDMFFDEENEKEIFRMIYEKYKSIFC